MKKLVRDKIITITQNPENFYQTDNKEEILTLLKEKLNEEVSEYLESEELEELADIIEVCIALAIHTGHEYKDLSWTRKKKMHSRGGFYEGWIYNHGKGQDS